MSMSEKLVVNLEEPPFEWRDFVSTTAAVYHPAFHSGMHSDSFNTRCVGLLPYHISFSVGEKLFLERGV